MHYWLGKLFRVLSGLVAFAPRPVRFALGDAIGWLWFDVFRIRRGVALENLRRAFPEWTESQRVSCARRSLREMGRGLVEFTLFPFYKPEWFDKFFVIEGEEHLKAAREAGKGALLLGLHLSNGDFGIAAIARRGWPMNAISKEFKSKWLNDLWFGVRAKHGTKFISVEKSSFDILRALKRNEFVLFVLDQFMGPPIGVRTRFFGHETGTAMGLALMAERTGAPVIPCYVRRHLDGRLGLHFEKAVPFQENSSREENIAIMTQVYTDKIEEIVRRHPDQWMWIHRRWKAFVE